MKKCRSLIRKTTEKSQVTRCQKGLKTSYLGCHPVKIMIQSHPRTLENRVLLQKYNEGHAYRIVKQSKSSQSPNTQET